MFKKGAHLEFIRAEKYYPKYKEKLLIMGPHQNTGIINHMPAFWKWFTYQDEVLCLPLPVELILIVQSYLRRVT